MRLLNFATFLLLLTLSVFWSSSLRAQNFIPKRIQAKQLCDSLRSIPYQSLSDSALSLYWLNRSWPEHKVLEDSEEQLNVIHTFIDSARYYAQRSNCTSCGLHIELLKINHYLARGIEVSMPNMPQNLSPSLELHYLGTQLNQAERSRKSISPEKVDRIILLIKNEEVGLLQRLVMADMLATYSLYPKGRLKEALELYQLGANLYFKPDFPQNIWTSQMELPGIFSLPSQKISRCFLNAAFIQRELGDFKGAIQNLIGGTSMYRVQKDTLGLLWAYRDLSHVYTFQRDFENAKAYLDSSLDITTAASKNLFASNIQGYSGFLYNHYELAFEEGVGEGLLDQLESLLPDGSLVSASTTDNIEILHSVLLTLNLKVLGNYWNNVPLDLTDIEEMMPFVDSMDLSQKMIEEDIRALLKSQYNLAQTILSSDLEDIEKYKHNYYEASRNIRSVAYKKAFYIYSRRFLMDLKDYDFLLQLNKELSIYFGEISMPMMQLAKDRSESWEALGFYDSALYNLRVHTQIKDSLINQQNYIELTRADLKLKTAETQQKSQLLLAENKLNQLQIVILAVVAFALFIIAMLIRQRRIKDKVIAKRNSQLLELQAKEEAQRNEILKHKNQQLEKELRVDIVQTLQQQNHNLELAEMVNELKEVSESTQLDKKTHLIKRKLGEYSVESSLYEIEKQAIKVYPQLYEFLRDRLSQRNKMELMLCIMLVMNYSSEDVARLLQRSDKAIRSLRYRVRKRLELEENQDLVLFLKKHSN